MGGGIKLSIAFKKCFECPTRRMLKLRCRREIKVVVCRGIKLHTVKGSINESTSAIVSAWRRDPRDPLETLGSLVGPQRYKAVESHPVSPKLCLRQDDHIGPDVDVELPRLS